MPTSKIIYLVGIAVAIIGSFVAIPYGGIAIAVLGIAWGVTASDDRTAFLIMAIALSAVAGALGAIPVAGDYITGILTGISGLVNAAAVTMICRTLYEKAAG